MLPGPLCLLGSALPSPGMFAEAEEAIEQCPVEGDSPSGHNIQNKGFPTQICVISNYLHRLAPDCLDGPEIAIATLHRNLVYPVLK